MGIKGIIKAYPRDFRVATLRLNEEAYLYGDELVITRKGAFLCLLSPLISIEEYKKEENGHYEGDYIHIRRTGNGLTENDFELDLTELNQENYFALDSEATYLEFSNNKEDHILFTDGFILNVFTDPPRETIETLQISLEKAIAEENFELAKDIQLKIDTFEEKG